MVTPVVDRQVNGQAHDAGAASAPWPTLYAQYLTRSANQSARTLGLYQEVMDGIARGELPPTVFQDMLSSFVQARGTAYSEKLAGLSTRFFTGMVQISAAFSGEMAALFGPGSPAPPPAPPAYDPLNPVIWYQELTEYAGRLAAAGRDVYRGLLERVASGEIEPGRIQQESARYIEQRLPEHMARLGELYFDLLNGLNDLRAASEEDYLNGILVARQRNQEASFGLNLSAALGEMASTSLSLANTRNEPVVVRYAVTGVRRADGIGPAFAPQVSFNPEALELQPGQEGTLTLILRLQPGDYEPQVLYVGALHIMQHGEPQVEVPLHIKAS